MQIARMKSTVESIYRNIPKPIDLPEPVTINMQEYLFKHILETESYNVRIPEEGKPEMIKCSRCGHEDNAVTEPQFCSQCGTYMKKKKEFKLDYPNLISIPQSELDKEKGLRKHNIIIVRMSCATCKLSKKKKQALYATGDLICTKFHDAIMDSSDKNYKRCECWINPKIVTCQNCGYIVEKHRKCTICGEKL
jgi:ribosomal protein L37E